jgi:hypothetical protein
MPRLTEVRHGRNFIRHGDLVKARPSRAGKHDGFIARFLYADTDKGGLYYALQELDNGGKSVAFRFLKAVRIKRLATTKQPFR